MQSNKIHKVFKWVSLFSIYVSSTCFGPHRFVIRSVLYKLYVQIWYVVTRVLLDTSSRYEVVGRTCWTAYILQDDTRSLQYQVNFYFTFLDLYLYLRRTAIHLLPLWAFVACYRVNFTFTFTFYLCSASGTRKMVYSFREIIFVSANTSLQGRY